ncbi:MAG TPA: MFS transporter [Actinomycetota bacterium]|nr:MFS transporter [Actinomycetota bacterium]
MFRPKLSPIWQQRNFRLLWFGETISLLGSTVSHFALPVVAVVTLHVSAGQMGLMRALGSAPSIVLGLLAGVWVDRLDRRRLLVATNLLAAVLMASVPIAHVVGSLTVFHLYALWFAFGILGAFWWPAWNSFLPSIVPPDDLVEANSKVEFAWSSMGVAGPALGALLISWFTAPGVLAFDAATFVICAGFIVRIRPPAVTTDDGPRVSTFRQIQDGLRATFVDVMQRAITIPRVILDFVDGLSLTVFALYVLREVGLSPALLGVALALSWLGFALGAAIAPRLERRLGIGTMIVLGLLLVGISPYTMVIANRGFRTGSTSCSSPRRDGSAVSEASCSSSA